MPPIANQEDQKKPELNDEAAKQYTHTGPHAVWQTRAGESFDIRTITIAAIENLIKDGCDWFEKKVDKKVDKTPPATS